MESKEDDDPSKIADQSKVVALYAPCMRHKVWN